VTIPDERIHANRKSIFTTPNTINYFGFHPTLPYILVLDKDAALTPWHFFAVKDKFIIPSEVNEDPIRPVHVEMENRNKHLPEYIKIPTESLSMCEMRVHGRFNFISFIFKVHLVDITGPALRLPAYDCNS
jgi:hypothetical protein